MSKVSLYPTQSGNRMCYVLRWRCGTKRMSSTIGWVKDGKGNRNGSKKYLSSREAEALRKDKQDELAVEADRAKQAAQEAANPRDEPASVPNRVTLREFYDGYAARRRRIEGNNRGPLRDAPKLSEASITSHLMTLRYLLQDFGDDRAIDSITLADAERFVERLSAGELEAARRTKQRYTLTDEGIKCHIRNAKALFGFMLLFDLIAVNPFARFSAKSVASKHSHYVTLGEFRKLFNARPTQGWGMFFALCRLAGLRREAARTLPWRGVAVDSWGNDHRVGVDWDRHRLLVVGNCKATDHPLRYREVPICPLLYRLLRKTYEASPARFGHPDEEAKPISGVSRHNLIKLAKGMCIDARLRAWPKMYQSMRAACENDWKRRGVPEATYTAWLGHSSSVSRTHYVRPLDSEFNAIARVA